MDKSLAKGKARVVWITNLPAPYRIPIWDRLSDLTNLQIFFLLKEENWRNWKIEFASNWSFKFLSKSSIRISEYEFVFSPFGSKRVLSGADVVIVGGWESPFYFFVYFNARRNHIPIIQFYESTMQSHRFNGPLIRYLRRRIFSLADHVVTAGAASTTAVLDMGINSSKILTLFNPVDVCWFAEFAANYRVETRSGHRFLYVGRLIDLKNVCSLIVAFASMRQTDDSLTIVGAGPLASDLMNQVSQVGLQDSIHFLGHHDQKEVALDYASADTLVLPSTNEVWGLVVNEALACGLHVVVSKAAGVAEFVAPMKGAFICEPTVIGLKEALIQSRSEWEGVIPKPEVMEYTPERFADALGGLLEKWKLRLK